MLRVTAGEAKGIVLKSPKWITTRPMTERVKGAIFDILGAEITAARVLDLYAGTGAVGIEALSRGASWVDFVDIDSKCVRLIQTNLTRTHYQEQSRVHQTDALQYVLKAQEASCDLIFFTPPYPVFSVDVLLVAARLLCADGTLVAEMDAHDPIDPAELKELVVWQMKEYGDTRLLFLTPLA